MTEEFTQALEQLTEEVRGVRADVKTLMIERHNRQRWVNRGVTLWLGVMTIVGGGVILHLLQLHWAP
jgi:hypothetical protein